MRLAALDGFNLLFRSFTSLPPSIVDEEDLPIHAVYGMISFITRLIREDRSDWVVAAFDAPDTPTFRHALYPGYQAHRGPLGGESSADFTRQVGIARDVLPALGIPVLIQSGYEADDLLGSVARTTCRERIDHHVSLVSTDRDLLQLVGEHVEVIVPGKELRRIIGAQGVVERLGVPPPAVPAYKALAGDPSDNIPGLPGIGPKTAARLINDYGSLENLYGHLDDLPARTARIVRDGYDQALLYQRVATIETGLAVPETYPALAFGPSEGPRALLERGGHPMKRKKPADDQ